MSHGPAIWVSDLRQARRSFPLLSVVIPTIGRDGLARALASVERQPGYRPDLVEVIVVGDTLDGPLPLVAQTVRDRGHRWIGHNGGVHCFGQPQRQAGMEAARGRWIAFLADDDIWSARALETILRAIRSPELPCSLPLVARVITPWRAIVWAEQALRQANVDANGIIVPNEPERLGRWSTRYEGDFDMLSETASNYGGVAWVEAVVSIARPEPSDDWTRTA